MYILTLVTSTGLYSHRRIQEAAEARGHRVRFLDANDCWINVMDLKACSVKKEGRSVSGERKISAIIPFIGSHMTFYGTSVLRQLERPTIFTLNTAESISRTRDKLENMQLLLKQKLPMPKTALAHAPNKTEAIIDAVGGAPVVIKLVHNSSQGNGVVLAETKQAAVSVIHAFKVLNTDILVQEFIKESSGRDIRCFVLGDRVIASMERVAGEGEFRSNFHRGGSVHACKISQEEHDMAVKAAKVLGLEMAGVDILRSHKGPLVLEVNAYPGFEGLEKATNIDIATEIIKYVEKRVEEIPDSEKE